MANSGLETTDTPVLSAAVATECGLHLRRRWWQGLCCLPALKCLDNPEKKRKALVQKNGSYRVHTSGLWGHRSKFLADMYITVIDLEWRYILLSLFATFFITIMFFGFFWWLMGYTNGDFDNLGRPDHEFCLRGITSIAGVILFSMETQTTIGYGVAFPNPHCPATVPLLFVQVMLGLLLETFMLGAIFVKIGRPKYRANTILFSSHAVINQENGQLVLQVRVGDVRKSHLVRASITGMVIRGLEADEDVYYPLYQHHCEFKANKMADRMCLLWPVIITHVIDKDSPLYDVGPADSGLEKNFEVILYLSGFVESTGETCQARTSYIASEILWGHVFREIEEFDFVNNRWRINFSGFNTTTFSKKIVHSAKELDAIQTVTVDVENSTQRQKLGVIQPGTVDENNSTQRKKLSVIQTGTIDEENSTRRQKCDAIRTGTVDEENSTQCQKLGVILTGTVDEENNTQCQKLGVIRTGIVDEPWCPVEGETLVKGCRSREIITANMDEQIPLI